jgi:hypothetical protein
VGVHRPVEETVYMEIVLSRTLATYANLAEDAAAFAASEF